MEPKAAGLSFHHFRHHVLDEIPEEFATEDLMLAAGRLVYGDAALWRVFNLEPHEIVKRDVRVRCRTLIESIIDSMAAAIATDTRQRLVNFGASALKARPTIYDLFCGSGNLTFHFLSKLDCKLRASEMDPNVFPAVENNFRQLEILSNENLELANCNYQQLLAGRCPASGLEIYVVDLPFGDAFSEGGFDFTKTKPSLPQILEDIAPSTRGSFCLVILKWTDSIVQPAFDEIWSGAKPVAKVYTEPKLEFGKNTVFFVYFYGS